MRTMPHALSALCFMALLCAPFSATVHAAAMLAADQGGGYSGQVLEKVAKHWQAPQYSSDHTVRVRVSIDGDGKVLSCKPEQSSNLALMDKSACSAVHTAEKFAPPPYGLPIDVFLTFWTGLPKGGSTLGAGDGRGTIDQNTLAQQNADAATAAAIALAKAAEVKAAEATRSAAPKSAAGTAAAASPAASLATSASPTASVSPATAASSSSADSQNRAPLVGIPPEAASPEEARYARKIAFEIREKMIIPAELPKGTYLFKMYVHIDSKGQISKPEITQSSGEAVMDKYALRAIKRLTALTPPPTKKAHDLHLTFVVLRP